MNVALVIGNGLLHLSTVEAWLFIGMYHLSSPWWKSEAGRHVMTFMGVIAAVLTLSSVRVATGAPPSAEPVTWVTWVRVLVFAGVPAVIGWRIAILWRAQFRGRTWAQIRGQRKGRQF